MKVLKKLFGTSVSGQKVYKYTLINDNKIQISFINLGGYITDVLTKDKYGKLENIVLSYDDLRSYEQDQDYFGCLVGRVAGRISNGKAVIDGVRYNLTKNDNKVNHIHGGFEGFNKKLWNVRIIENEDSICAVLEYESKDGEENYPGNLKVKVKYILSNNNEFSIDYNAVTDKTTIVNMTNHSNFNLSGNYKRNILDHYLYINSDQYVKLNKQSIPENTYSTVKSTVFDFTNEKQIKDVIKVNDEQIQIANGGIDHPFVLNKRGEGAQVVLKDLESGRILEIKTTNNCAVIYTSNYVDKNVVLKNNVIGSKYLGICLETQNLPDAINKDKFPSIILKPSEKYHQVTTYRFKTI